MSYRNQTDEMEEISNIKNLNVSALEAQQTALRMVKDGFSTEQIAEALGYSVDIINNFIQLKVEVGSPEEVLQESLRTIVSLIPIAEAMYRAKPAATYAYTLTGFIESARSIIDQAYNLRSKEDIYRNIVAKVLQPFCREMVKSMLNEVGTLKGLDSNIEENELKNFSTNLGKKFQECYRKSTEDLAIVLGVSPDARARIINGNEPTE